jgi:hypothetical protein
MSYLLEGKITTVLFTLILANEKKSFNYLMDFLTSGQ